MNFEEWYEQEIGSGNKPEYEAAKWAWNHQQAKIDAITKQRDSFIKAHHISMNDVCEHKTKIDELQKLRSLDEMAINQLAQANQVWRTKCDELQARIDVYDEHVKALKNIHENDFNEESKSSYILGNLDGFFECIESDLKGWRCYE